MRFLSLLLLTLLPAANSLADDPGSTRGRPPAGDCKPELKEGDLLYLGDSISVMPYGAELAKALKGSAGAMVARFAVGGSSATHWVRGFSASFFRHTNTVCESRRGLAFRKVPGQQVPTFPAILAAGKPAATVIALGTNDLHNYCADGGGKSWIEGARQLAQSVPGKCVWVLPLTYRSGLVASKCSHLEGGMKGAIQKLRQVVEGKCQIVDSSQDCPMELGFDPAGIHPEKGSDRLGKCIGEKVKAKLGG